jgi:hypothetical protein
MNVHQIISFGGASFALCGNEYNPTLVPIADVICVTDENVVDNEACATPKTKGKKQPFPPELLKFSFADLHFLKCGIESDPAKEKDHQNH